MFLFLLYIVVLNWLDKIASMGIVQNFLRGFSSIDLIIEITVSWDDAGVTDISRWINFSSIQEISELLFQALKFNYNY